MNSGCSLSKGCATCSGFWRSKASCHQTSRSLQAVSWPVRLTTKTFLTFVLLFKASSTTGFNAKAAPLRKPPSAVITKVASASKILARSESAEKPPKTTECAAPTRAHASIATAASGIIGI